MRLLPHPSGAPSSPRLSRVPGAPTPRSSSARALLSLPVHPPPFRRRERKPRARISPPPPCLCPTAAAARGHHNPSYPRRQSPSIPRSSDSQPRASPPTTTSSRHVPRPVSLALSSLPFLLSAIHLSALSSLGRNPIPGRVLDVRAVTRSSPMDPRSRPYGTSSASCSFAAPRPAPWTPVRASSAASSLLHHHLRQVRHFPDTFRPVPALSLVGSGDFPSLPSAG